MWELWLFACSFIIFWRVKTSSHFNNIAAAFVMNQCGTFEWNETGWTNVAAHVSVCIAHYRPPGGTDSHRLCWLLHLHLLPRHHSGHLRCLVVSILTSSPFHRTVLMVHAAFLPLFSSVSTIRNQRYHIHANLSFAILVAEILLLISARFDPGTVGTVDIGKIWPMLFLLYCVLINVVPLASL